MRLPFITWHYDTFILLMISLHLRCKALNKYMRTSFLHDCILGSHVEKSFSNEIIVGLNYVQIFYGIIFDKNTRKRTVVFKHTPCIKICRISVWTTKQTTHVATLYIKGGRFLSMNKTTKQRKIYNPHDKSTGQHKTKSSQEI